MSVPTLTTPGSTPGSPASWAGSANTLGRRQCGTSSVRQLGIQMVRYLERDKNNHINYSYHSSDSCHWRRSWRGPSRHCQQIAGSRGVVCCRHPHLHAPSPARHQISPHAGRRPRLRRRIFRNFQQCEHHLCSAVRRGWRLGGVTQPSPDQVPPLQLAVPGWSAPTRRCLPWHRLHYGTALI